MLALLLFALAATEWREFRFSDSVAVDLTFYNQSFYLALRDHGWLHSPTQNLYHGDAVAQHFAAIFYAILPFYAVWQSPLLLLLVSALAVGTCGVAIMLLARRLFGSAPVALAWFGLFALFPPVAWSVAINTFRELFIATAFLSVALLYYVQRNDRLFFAMLVLALLSKEDIAFLLPVWGLVAWLSGRGRRLAGAIALLGVVDFVLVNIVLLPLIRGMHPGDFVVQSLDSPLGNTPGALLHALVSSPRNVVHLVLSPQDLGYWGAILGPLLFLPLLGWEYLVIPAYVYVEIVLAPWMQHVDKRHIFPAIPFLLAASMVGTTRVVAFAARLSARSRQIVLAALLCGALLSSALRTDLPYLLRLLWPTDSGFRQRGAPLFQALSSIPPRASLAATEGLIAEVSSRRDLSIIGARSFYVNEADLQQIVDRSPDYIAIGVADTVVVDLIYHSHQPYPPITSLLCQGTYGVAYADRFGRMVLERGAPLSANSAVYRRFRLGPSQPCPSPVQSVLAPDVFTRAAAIHARTTFPSEIAPNDMFPEAVAALSKTRFVQVIHLPDHVFAPGLYRLELVGEWPWPGAAAYRATARVLVGGRTAGQVTAGGDHPLRYATPPFSIAGPGTQTVLVEVEVRTAGPDDDPPSPFAAWRSRELNVLRGVVVSRVSP